MQLIVEKKIIVKLRLRHITKKKHKMNESSSQLNISLTNNDQETVEILVCLNNTKRLVFCCDRC